MIIALETASTDVSLAVARADGTIVAHEGWSANRRQTHEILPRLLSLLDRGGLQLSDATAVAVGLGPGSFTGLRVGMSLAKGLALARDLPLVGVPSLPAWLASEPDAVAALARAGAREAYLLLRDEGEARVVDRDELPPLARQRRLLAPGELAEAFDLPLAVSPARAATAIATLAVERLRERPAGDDLQQLEPAYLRAPRGIGQVHHAAVP